jgi:hypothetical protein
MPLSDFAPPGFEKRSRRLPLCAAFALSRPSGGRILCEAIP